MKISDSQELKPIYIHEIDKSTNDELSLVDLAMILFHHKIMIVIIFATFTILGVVTALSTPKAYTFSTTIEIGSQIVSGAVVPFESPRALLAKLQHSYIPLILSEHKKSFPDDNKKYRIKSSVPSGSNITLLEIKGTLDQEKNSKKLLHTLSQKAIQDHSRIFDSVKANLKMRLDHSTNNLKTLIIDSKAEIGSKSEIAATRDTIESLTSQIANLRNTHEVLPPIRSLEPTGRSRLVTVIIFTFIGAFLALLTPFFTEFVSTVKEKIKKSKK